MNNALDTSALLKDYLDDAARHLDALDDALLSIERQGEGRLDRELVTSLLGSLHTLKGNSGMMGFVTIQKFIHQLEGVFKRLLDRPHLLTREVLDALFESASVLRNAVEQAGENPKPDLSRETVFLDSLAAPNGSKNKAGRKKKTTEMPRAEEQQTETEVPNRTNTLRVDFERLDHLLNLAGELVIHKTKLNQIVRNLDDLVGAEEFFGELPGVAQQIEKTTTELQEAIMRVRMLPIKHVFQRFPRMVRDLARQKGKEAEIIFSGEETEIDKTVIDALGEPLIHLIRNAIDHGIEPPEVRIKSGKPRTGAIHLSARQESNHIVISVADDGAGMDAARIKQKAVEKGLLNAEQQLSDQEIFNLIFLPGFSTVDRVTETSGRGVGLDVVKKVIGDFNGIIEVSSTPGLGTEFVLKMPLTLAIIPALLVEVSGEIYAVPLTAVIETVKINASEIHKVDGKEVVQLRGSVLQIKRLSNLLGLPLEERRWSYMVVLGRAERRIGLLVDRLRGQQEVVIKALDDYLGDTFGISGATILGDGRVVLIVDTSKIVETMKAR